MRLLLVVSLLSLLPTLARSRFQLEVQLQTAVRREMTVTVLSAFSVEPVFRSTSFIDDSKPSRLLLDARPELQYTLKLEATELKEVGVESTWITIRLPPNRFWLVPPTVMPPLTGLSVRMHCAEFWFGNTCDVHCDERMNQFRRVRCYKSGVLGCPRGLQGSNCSEPLEPESCGCSPDGECGYSAGKRVCVCRDGFEGQKCDVRSSETRDVPISTFSKFTDPIPNDVSVDELYEKKRVPNRILIPKEHLIQD